MPTYEYACKSCAHAWETVQRITENALDTCPKCNEKTAQRLLSGGSFILKGGGWYADLYSSPKSASPKADASGGSTPSTASTASTGASPGAGTSTAPSSPSSPSSPAPSGGSGGSGGSSGGSSGSSSG